jgi:hypothetical protein
MPGRSPEEIRASIEANRMALAVSIERLRPALISAALAGFLLGGGLAVFRRRRR